LAKPQPFDVTRSAAAEVFVAQIAVHAATWCQPYLNRIFIGEPLEWAAFISNRQQRAEVALRVICQTGTVSSYTQDFHQHARTARWPDAPLMSLYQNGIKENIQLAVVMSNIQFDSLR
ncbi:uncharacterized protein VP01_14221g1, partial [Puccinia sorghi]